MPRKTPRRKMPAESRLRVALAACAFLGLVPVAQAAKPSRDFAVAMQEPSGAPAGTGWSAISTVQSEISPTKPVAVATAIPAIVASNDGWQALGAAAPMIPAAHSVAPATIPSSNEGSTSAKAKPATAGESPVAAQISAPVPAAVAVPDATTGAPFTLIAGQSMESQLIAWSKRVGWVVTWNTPDDWIVPNDRDYGPDFQMAVTQVVSDAQGNGADLQADIWQANRTVVIDKTGAIQ